MPTLSPPSVCAVIVTYNAGPELQATYDAIRPQVSRVVMVDNSEGETTWNILQTIAASDLGATRVIRSDQNNLALAQNLGIAAAKEAGLAWVLLLDQDSIASPDMVQTMLSAYATEPQHKSIGILAPLFFDVATGHPPNYVKPIANIGFRRVNLSSRPTTRGLLSVIASGSLIATKLFDTVEGMDTRLVIDYVDIDFCLRARRAGFDILLVRDAMLRHQLGKREEKQLLGKRISTSNHPPLRRYYIYRNRLRLWFRHLGHCPAFMVHDYCSMCFDLVRIALYEQNRRQKFLYIARGVRDALLGLSGPYQP